LAAIVFCVDEGFNAEPRRLLYDEGCHYTLIHPIFHCAYLSEPWIIFMMPEASQPLAYVPGCHPSGMENHITPHTGGGRCAQRTG